MGLDLLLLLLLFSRRCRRRRLVDDPMDGKCNNASSSLRLNFPGFPPPLPDPISPPIESFLTGYARNVSAVSHLVSQRSQNLEQGDEDDRRYKGVMGKIGYLAKYS